MTRILHVSDRYRPVLGGIEVLIEDLARRQIEAGDEVDVYTFTPGPPGAQRPGDPRVIRSRRGRWPLLRYLPDRRVLAGEYDVVHAHLSLVSPFATLLAKHAVRAGIPCVLSVHSMWAGRQHWLVRLVGLIAGWHDWPVRWTAVSSAAAAHVRRALPAGTDVVVEPNASDIDFWRDRLAPRPAAAGAVRIASVLRLVGRKRPLPLLDALRRVREAVPADVPLEVVLIGDGPRRRDMVDFLTRHDMQDWVRLTGELTREEIRELYRSVDLYVAPAHLESFGIAALEARAAGLPVVGMRRGGVGEFVEDGVTGRLCEDDDDLADALVALVTDPEARREMATRARDVAPDLGWDRALGGFAEAYAAARRAVSPRLARR